LFWTGQSYALELSDRSVTVYPATPSAASSHAFKMTIASPAAIGSILFEYCSNSPDPKIACISPAGLALGGANLSQQAGNTGFSIDTVDSTPNSIVISRPAVAAAVVPTSYTFTNIVNPSVSDQTTFVRIYTFGSTDSSGPFIDNGSVAFSTSNSFNVGAYIPPNLNLCVGVTVAIDCSWTNGENLNLGILGTKVTGIGTTQFSAYTNEFTGYSMYVLGTTITSGNNIVPGAYSPTGNQVGVSEFGMNLRKNISPNVGQNPAGIGTAVIDANYDSPNLYTFNPGDQLLNSDTSTNYNRMTVSYIVNVDSTQPPGVYSTTLTYLASASF
jgi:hypothetical protein